MTAAERKAAQRQRYKDAGLVPVNEVWTHPTRKTELEKAITRFQKPKRSTGVNHE